MMSPVSINPVLPPSAASGDTCPIERPEETAVVDADKTPGRREFERVLREELVLAAPSGHPAAKGDGALDLRALSKENFIVPPREIAPGLYDLIISHCRSFGFAPRITQHARQMQTVISLVSCDMGFALVPSSLRNLKRTGVRYRQLRGKAALIELGILRLRNSDTPLKERFVEALKSPAPAR
jgi:DNA-binding transcriptional LysR family regulator